MPNREKTLANLFTQSAGLQSVLGKVHELNKIDKLVKQLLPDNYAEYVQVANLRQGCLVIQAENGAIATQLKYQAPTLLSQLRQKGMPGLSSINVIVRPNE